MTKTISVVIRKGGVEKTTTAVNPASALYEVVSDKCEENVVAGSLRPYSLSTHIPTGQKGE